MDRKPLARVGLKWASSPIFSMNQRSAWAIAAGLIAFCVHSLTVMAWLGPASLNPAESQTDIVQINMTRAILLNIGQVLFLLLITHVFQGSMLSTFKQELRGNYHSVTRSILTGFVASFFLASICMLILSVLGLMPMGTPNGSLT